MTEWTHSRKRRLEQDLRAAGNSRREAKRIIATAVEHDEEQAKAKLRLAIARAVKERDP